MENGTITEYAKRHPMIDRLELVSRLTSTAVNLVWTSIFAAVGCGRRPSLPSLAQRDPWGLELCKSFGSSSAAFSELGINLDGWKANILIDKDGQARLTGFGLEVVTHRNVLTSLLQDHSINTTTWPAPEILRGGPVTKEGDIFAFAMVTIEVHTRRVSRGSPLTYPSLKRYTQDVPLSLAKSKTPYLTSFSGPVPNYRICRTTTSYGGSLNFAGTKSRRNGQPLLSCLKPSGCCEFFSPISCVIPTLRLLGFPATGWCQKHGNRYQARRRPGPRWSLEAR